MAKLEIELSPTERTRLAALADEQGVSLAEYVRRKAVADAPGIDHSENGSAAFSSGEAGEAFWQRIQRRGQEVPASEWENVPADASVNHRHYANGVPRKNP